MSRGKEKMGKRITVEELRLRSLKCKIWEQNPLVSVEVTRRILNAEKLALAGQNSWHDPDWMATADEAENMEAIHVTCSVSPSCGRRFSVPYTVVQHALHDGKTKLLDHSDPSID